MSVEQLSHFINGEWVGGSSGSIDVFAPGTGAVVAALPVASAELVAEAAEAASTAFETWQNTTPKKRVDHLFALAAAMEARSEELAALESLDVGKPISSAREEMPLIIDLVRFFAGAARVSHGPAAGEYAPGVTSVVQREPIGVVGLITPWNYPLLEAVWKLIPALAAGNCAVLKPSEITPLTTVELFRCAADIFPAGVVNLVLGDGSTGAALVQHPKVRLISLTGDVSTGKKVAAAAAADLTRVHLELGGKAPVLVFDDVDVVATAQTLASCGFINTGQDCTAACRVIVHENIYDEFVEAYTKAAAALVVGDPSDGATEIGPLVSSRQRERVEGFVEEARATGATIQTGGGRLDGDGFFYPPTVITDVDQESNIVQNEVFGPVVTIQRANSDDQMLEWANAVRYGLSASVWTRDLARTQRCTRRLQFGTVWVNEHLTTVAEMPFGGFGESGYGKELSASSIDEYSQFKHVMVRAS